jgi:hypothetical protein
MIPVRITVNSYREVLLLRRNVIQFMRSSVKILHYEDRGGGGCFDVCLMIENYTFLYLLGKYVQFDAVDLIA